MNRAAWATLLFIVAYFALPNSIVFGVTLQLQSFGPEVYNSDPNIMNAALGLNGYAIESFEGAQLLSDLSVTFVGSFDGPGALPEGPFTSNFPAGLVPGFTWDGSKSLTTRQFYRTRTVFTLPANVDSFGIGVALLHRFSDADYWPIELLVNGIVIATLQNLPHFETPETTVSGATGIRNGYVIVTSQDSQSLISTVELRQPFLRPHGNEGSRVIWGVEYDHLAIRIVPEPTTLALGALGLLIAAHRRR